jgi:hypothetical protein
MAQRTRTTAWWRKKERAEGHRPRGSSAFHDFKNCGYRSEMLPRHVGNYIQIEPNFQYQMNPKGSSKGSIYIPAIIIGEQGAIGLLTEWQNLYVHRTIMVLGANEQANQTIANRASAVSERGLKARSLKLKTMG